MRAYLVVPPPVPPVKRVLLRKPRGRLLRINLSFRLD
jgi:hypothetical protein